MNAKTGFTFVEALMVAIAVSIIASVAIPLYQGYIKQAKEDRIQNLTLTAAASANAHYRKTGSHPSTIAELKLFINDTTKYDIDIDSTNRRIIVTYTTENISDTVNY